MSMMSRLARFAAALIVAGAFAMPTAASAHEGHVHHAPSAMTAAAAATEAAAAKSIAGQHGRVAEWRASPPQPDAGGRADCYCCTGCSSVAGMACCGAVLVPDFCSDPFVHSSQAFAIRQAPPLPGLSPEALPKPPKSSV